jgi:hypothetical protein
MVKYPSGSDIAWLASDSRGNAGVFVTGGSGPIPMKAFESCGDSISEVEGRLQTLAITSDFKLWAEMKRPADFVDFARRGLFAFDWRDAVRVLARRTSVYEKVASPSTPIALSSLSSELLKIAQHTSIPGVSFAEAISVDVNALLACLTK